MIYVLQCLSGKEALVKHDLQRLGYTVLLPTALEPRRRAGIWHTHWRILMPGYLFIACAHLDAGDYARMKYRNYVLRLLGSPIPQPLSEEEEAWIRWAANQGRPLEVSRIKIGDQVKVVSGPLYGREGEILRLDKHKRKATLWVTTAGVSHRVTLGLEIIRGI